MPDPSRCVVVGAGSPVGRAVVADLTKQGIAVTAVDVEPDVLAEATTAGAATLAADVSLPAGRTALRTAAAGARHLVVVPAAPTTCPLDEVTEELWDAVLTQHARTVFLVLQAVCPLLPARGSAVVVSSVAGKTSRNPEIAVYSASEAAVLSLVRSFANAHAVRGVRVNAICTGIVETPENERYLAEVAAARGTSVETLSAARFALVPMGRAARPEECARTVRALLSDDTSFVTGQAVNVTGGFHNY